MFCMGYSRDFRFLAQGKKVAFIKVERMETGGHSGAGKGEWGEKRRSTQPRAECMLATRKL